MEREQKYSKIFPLSNYASETAYENLFSLSTTSISIRHEKLKTGLSKELDIMGKHYPKTLEYLFFMESCKEKFIPNTNNTIFKVAMLYMHHASRIESQTKKTSLPVITEAQLIKYIPQSSIFEYDLERKEFTDMHTAPVVERFYNQENTVNTFLNKRLRNDTNLDGFKLGSALMWDFLKTAPTIK